MSTNEATTAVPCQPAPRHRSVPRRPVRLRDGCHLYAAGDGSWRIAAYGDEFLHLALSAEQAGIVERLVVWSEAPATVLANRDDADEFHALLDELDAAGVVEQMVAGQRPAVPKRVVITGTNAVAAMVVALLAAEEGVRPACVETADPVTALSAAPPPDLIVSCAGWLPDSTWQRLDAWCHAHAVAWHRVHAEAGRWYVGPLFLPGQTAGYCDTRARRLAAAALPDDLETYWQVLERPDAVPPPRLATCAVAVIAGLLVADIIAVLAGRPAPSAGDQLAFDPGDLGIRRHPVLPLPDEVLSETWKR
jgi:hypothetical protein